MMYLPKTKHRLMAPAGDDGTDAGGSNTSGDGVYGTGNDARVALLNRIGDQHDAIRAEDLADVNDDGSTAPFEPPKVEDEEGTAEVDTQAQNQEAEGDVQTAEQSAQPTQQMITRKVNGKDVTLPLEEWLIRAQKVEAADEYLQQAAAAKRQAVQVPVAPVPESPPAPSTEELQAAERAKRRELARAIQMGTEEEAVAAIEQLQNMAKAPTLTVADISRVTDERLKFNNAINWFRNEYKDLVADPMLNKMVVDAEAELVRNGDRRPYEERYAEVGNQVRAWRDSLVSSVAASAPAPAPVASLADKRAAKAAAPQPPKATNAKAKPAPQEEEDDSPSAVIAAMAKARGGPQWARG